MKKVLTLFACLSLFSLSVMAENVFGVIYKNATEAGVGYSTASAVKMGEATCTSYFALVALGDCSVNAAAKKAGIRTVSYYDTQTRNILGYKRVTVRAYGN